MGIPRIISINKQVVKAGTNAIINLNIARLASGTKIDLPIYVFRSAEPGPIILLSGGLHGDEVNGIEIVRRLVNSDSLKHLQKGSVIAIPIMNIYGFLNFSRQVPDGKDINRSFPGNQHGSLASRVAYNLTHKVLREIDFGIDFHTGGASRYNYPQLRFSPKDQKAREISDAFNAPISLESPLIEKTLRKEAFKLDKSIVVFEGGESSRFDEHVIEQGVRGARRVLKYYGMIARASSEEEQIHCKSSSWVRAKNSGMFTSFIKSGEIITKNQILGKITDPFGEFETKVKASYTGIMIGHNNMPVVNQGIEGV